MDTNEVIKQRARQLDAVKQKWSYLTDHLKQDAQIQGLVAQLLENQAADKMPLFDTDQTTTNLPTSVFPKSIALPVVVQAFPALVANEIVQVQPMRAPNGLVPYMRFIRSSNGNELTRQGSWTYTAETAQPPKVRMRWDMLDLAVEKFMLNIEWSAEVEEDASALAGIDFQAEMITAVRSELQGQIDYMVIRDLFAAAASAPVNGSGGMLANPGGAGNVNFDTDTLGTLENAKDHQAMILDAIIDLKTQIYVKSNTVADFIVGGPAAVANIEKLQTFAPDTTAGIRLTTGTARVGRLQGQYDVYVSAAAPANQLLMGSKRKGYVLGIYRPLELTPITYQNESDEYIRGVRTRVARKLVDASYFGTLTFTT